LFGVEAKGGFLRGVLADGESAWSGLGGELVAEAGELLEIGHDGPLCWDKYGLIFPDEQQVLRRNTVA
jgi:hypothetical protein